MRLTVFVVIAVWPLAGLILLYGIGRIGSRPRGRAVLPPARTGAEVLARMYLWPLVLLRIYRGRRP